MNYELDQNQNVRRTHTHTHTQTGAPSQLASVGLAQARPNYRLLHVDVVVEA